MKKLISAILSVTLAVCAFSLSSFGEDTESVEPLQVDDTTQAITDNSSKETTLVTYPVPSGPETNDSYTVKARPLGTEDWTELTVFKARVMSNGARWAGMVYFDCDGPIELQVTCNKDIDNIETGLNDETAVYPKSYNTELNYEIGGNVITLTAMPNQRIVLDPNGDTRRNLQIWSGNIINMPTVEELEAQNKTVTCVDASKGDKLAASYDTDVVYVKPGYYDNGINNGFSVKSNQTWYLEGGAVLHETLSLDYAKNAKVIGRGMIYRPQYAAISVNDTENVYVEGTMALNYSWADNGGYGVNISNSKNVIINNAKSIGNGKWGDCMDIFCSEDVTVKDCFFRGNDDCIAIYGPRWNGSYWGDTGNVRNIKVEGCVLMPDLARPIHFGTHGDSSSPNGGRVIDNCRFKNIDILTYNKYAWRTENDQMKRMPQPIRMDVSEGNSVTNVLFDDIRIEDYMANGILELYITTQDRYGTYSVPGKGINNIYFKNIEYKNTDETFSGRIDGYTSSNGTDGITQNVTFENLLVNGVRAKNAEDAHINIGNNAKNIKFVNQGEAKYIYNPSIVPEDIWPDFYDYASISGAEAYADISENNSQASYAIDNDLSTVWYSQAANGNPIYYNSADTENPGVLIGNGLTLDLKEQRHVNCVRITWNNPMLSHSYLIYVSKDGTNWSAGHTDEHDEGAVNSKARADYNMRVKSTWLANQVDEKMGQEAIIGRYVKVIPISGSQLDIAKIEILGTDIPQ